MKNHHPPPVVGHTLLHVRRRKMLICVFGSAGDRFLVHNACSLSLLIALCPQATNMLGGGGAR
jgi:hypothetical protein